jgi:hypothetical protein
LTLDLVSYIGGSSTATTYGVFNIRGIPRLGLPEIDICNGPLGIQSLIGHDDADARLRGSFPATSLLMAAIFPEIWSRRAPARSRSSEKDQKFWALTQFWCSIMDP